MSQMYGDTGSTGASPSGTVETAKQEATNVAETAKDEAGHVVETAKAEAGAVAHEAKAQLKDLYAQTRTELREQASVQQRRVADGLRSVGGELQSMADNSDGSGLAADLVRQASTKVSAAASWLGDRDPGSLLQEVKSYARRRPGVFIAAAALAGLAVGRLTRALSENAADHTGGSDAGATGSAMNRGAGTASASADAAAAGFAGGVGANPAAAGTAAAGVPTAPTTAGSESGEWVQPPAGAPQAPDGIPGDVSAVGGASSQDTSAGDTSAGDTWAADTPAGDPASGGTPVFDETEAARQTGWGDTGQTGAAGDQWTETGVEQTDTGATGTGDTEPPAFGAEGFGEPDQHRGDRS